MGTCSTHSGLQRKYWLVSRLSDRHAADCTSAKFNAAWGAQGFLSKNMFPVRVLKHEPYIYYRSDRCRLGSDSYCLNLIVHIHMQTLFLTNSMIGLSTACSGPLTLMVRLQGARGSN